MTPHDLLHNTGNLSWRTAIPTANTGRIRRQHMRCSHFARLGSFLRLKDYWGRSLGDTRRRNREQEDKCWTKWTPKNWKETGFRPGCVEVKYDLGFEAQPPDSPLVTDVDFRQVNHKIGSKEVENNNCDSLAKAFAPLECWHSGHGQEVEGPLRRTPWKWAEGSWRDGSLLKSTCRSWGGLGFTSPHPHQVAQNLPLLQLQMFWHPLLTSKGTPSPDTYKH